MIDVQKLARDAGMKASIGKIKGGKYEPDVNALFSSVPIEWLERFAALVLEEAALLCDARLNFGDAGASMCASAIRALKDRS